MADVSPVKRHKGKFVLLAVALALAGYVIIGHAGIAWFDATDKHEGAEQAIKDAENASVQWLTYLSRSGRPDTDLGKRAAEELGRGADARAAGDMETAQRACQTAWQAYANAFREESEHARHSWDLFVGSTLSNLKGRFPFDPSAARGAAPVDLSQLVNPVNGLFWQRQKWFEACAAVNLPGVQTFSPAGLPEFAAAAEKLRDTLFAPGEDKLSIRFSATATEIPSGLRLVLWIDWNQVVVPEGGANPLKWEQGQGCGIDVNSLGLSELPSLDYLNDQWGLLRMLWKLERRGAAANSTTWSIPNGANGNVLLTTSHNLPHDPFDPHLYSALRLP